MNARIAVLLRWSVSVLLALVLSLLCVLLVATVFPQIVFGSHSPSQRFTVLLLAIAAPLIVWIVLDWRHVLGARTKFTVAIVSAIVLGWLAWDPAPASAPAPAAESKAGSDVHESYTALMRYSSSPESRKEATALLRPLRLAITVGLSGKPAERREYVLRNRDAIEQDWTALAPARAWIDELNRFTVIGDETAPRFDSFIINFQVWRALSQRVCAKAALLAVDGHGDDAMLTLLPMLEVSHKLEPSARILVRQMSAKVIQGMCLDTTEFILNTTSVSPAVRARVAAALNVNRGAEGARRIVLAEQELWGSNLWSEIGAQAMMNTSPRWATRPVNVLAPFFLNRHATLALQTRHMQRLADLAATRDLEGMKQEDAAFYSSLRTRTPKNLGGRVILDSFGTTFDKIVGTYWRIEDLRTKVRAELLATPT